jgi:twitching motility protein PilT
MILMISMHQLLKAAVKQNASDLHIVAGCAPALRIEGTIAKVKTDALSVDDTRRLCYSVMTDGQKSEFEENKVLDFSFGVKNMARFRANIFYQRGAVSGVFRKINLDIPDLETLNLPRAIQTTIEHPHGLILVTGPTGSGKSTTIAGLIDKYNRERRGHIITLEDPIEYVHTHKGCIVNQREIGSDAESYKSALKYVLRQDPDVIVMGELRDLETVEAALSLAETGHLVFATLHTNTAIASINRMVSLFDSGQQDRVRTQLSFVLVAVVTQKLIAAKRGGLTLSSEILLPNPGIRNLIRENKLHQIYSMMQLGQNDSGMQTMNQSLFELVVKRRVDVRHAFLNSPDPDELDKMLKQAGM